MPLWTIKCKFKIRMYLGIDFDYGYVMSCIRAYYVIYA